MTIDVIFQAVDKVSKSIDGIGKSIDRISQSMANFGGKMVAINQSIEAFDRMGQAVDEITAPYREFEQSMAELSSITGIVGDDLGMLGEVARKTGIDSGLGAKGASQAFALLASQIDVSKIGMDGLIGLQKETITLAQAAGMTMDESANAMAGTINQFGLQATEANRVINVLAAGSKYGAASIPDLAQSFKVVGAAANAAGLSIEDTAGIVEVLSKNNLKGAEAGTAMRNIMLKMQTTLGVDFTKTSFAEALEALKPKMKDAAYMAKVFGMESMAAAQFLIANSDSVKEMTDRVTATNVASEQAAINTNTWNFSLDVQAAKLNETLMWITENNKEIFSLIQTGSKYMRMLTSFAPMFQVLKTGAMGLWDGFRWLTKGIEALGGKSRLAAAGMWIKNVAMTAGSGIMSTYRLLTNALTWDIMRQGIANKINGAWIAICSRAQMVASAISSIWAKRTAILTLVQGGLSKALNIAKIAMLTGVIPALTGVIASTWAWTTALLANPIVWIVGIIAGLIAAVAWCWDTFEGFRAVIYTIWDTIKGFGAALWDFLVAPFEAVWGFVKGIGDFFGTLFGGGSLEEAGEAFGKSMGDGIEKSTDRVKSGVAGMKNTANSIGDNYDRHLAEETEKQQQKEAKKTSPAQPQIPTGFSGFDPANLGGGVYPEIINNFEQTSIEIPGQKTIEKPISQPSPKHPKVDILNQMPTAETSNIEAPDVFTNVEQPNIEIPGQKAIEKPTAQLPQPKVDVLNLLPTAELPTINEPEVTINLEQPNINVTSTPNVNGVNDAPTPKMPTVTLAQSMINNNYQAMGNQSEVSQTEKPLPAPMIVPQVQPTPVFERNRTKSDNNETTKNAPKIDITYNPIINISGEMSQKSKEDFLTLLRNNASEIARLIKEELRKQERGNYGIPAIG